jgi:hypothetical protein
MTSRTSKMILITYKIGSPAALALRADRIREAVDRPPSTPVVRLRMGVYAGRF